MAQFILYTLKGYKKLKIPVFALCYLTFLKKKITYSNNPGAYVMGYVFRVFVFSHKVILPAFCFYTVKTMSILSTGKWKWGFSVSHLRLPGSGLRNWLFAISFNLIVETIIKKLFKVHN